MSEEKSRTEKIQDLLKNPEQWRRAMAGAIHPDNFTSPAAKKLATELMQDANAKADKMSGKK
jgi:hypothetical protein